MRITNSSHHRFITHSSHHKLVSRRALRSQVPICKVTVARADGTPVLSQVTAQFTINDGLPPFYDFDLHFEAHTAPLAYATYVVTPSTGGCGGGDVTQGAAAFLRHEPTWPPEQRATPSLDQMISDRISEQRQMETYGSHTAGGPSGGVWGGGLASAESGGRVSGRESAGGSTTPAATTTAVMENKFMKVYVDLSSGIKAVLDKGSGVNYSFTHELMEYKSLVNDAYDFKVSGKARPLGGFASAGTAAESCAAGPCFTPACTTAPLDADEHCTFSLRPAAACKAAGCVGWRQTAGCDPLGARQPTNDKACSQSVNAQTSGFCDCGGNVTFPFACDLESGRPDFTCEAVCGAASGRPPPAPSLLASSVALGPVMQEVRLQLSAEHKTRIRLWVSDDEAVGGRLELGHRLGVLEQKSEIISRFGVAELQRASFYSEDNGYEVIRHASGSAETAIPQNHFPSQMSTFLSDGEHQLSIALAHAHGVASLYNGTLDVVQHRRGGPFSGSGGTVVIDDSDRIFSETWVAIGNVSRSNTLRHANKLRLNHPLQVLFAPTGRGRPASRATTGHASDGRLTHGANSVGERAPGDDPLASVVKGLPSNVLLQGARATSSSRDELLVSLLHVFGEGESPAGASQPVDIDLAALLRAFRPELSQFDETILNGLIPKADLTRLKWNTTQDLQGAARTRATRSVERVLRSAAQITIDPFELKAYMVK